MTNYITLNSLSLSNSLQGRWSKTTNQILISCVLENWAFKDCWLLVTGPWLLEALAPRNFCVDVDQAETNLERVRLYYFIVTAITDYHKLSGLKH